MTGPFQLLLVHERAHHTGSRQPSQTAGPTMLFAGPTPRLMGCAIVVLRDLRHRTAGVGGHRLSTLAGPFFHIGSIAVEELTFRDGAAGSGRRGRTVDT